MPLRAISTYVARRVERGLADQLASETFVRAFARRHSYDAAYVDARPWLYGIATNLLHKHQRSEGRRRRAYSRSVERNQTGDGLDGLDGVVARFDAAASGPALAAALARLQPVDRETLLLLALTDLDCAGIAIATAVPVGTVRSRLHRARRHVRNELALSQPSPALENARSERGST